MALIAAAGLTPDNADLAQVLKAIKLVDVLNVFKQATNGGTAAAWAMTCPTLPVMPPPVGTAVWFKPGVASVNGGTTFSLNGSAPKPVVCVDLSPIHIGDIVASAWLLLFFDGANWQVVAGSSRAPGMLPPLFATTNWYVNGTTGDDAAYDGTAATHTSANHGPFRTIQRAADETLKYNMNGFDQFVHVADYGAGYANFDCKQTNGSGTVWFIGNEANPQNVPVTAATPNTHAIHQVGGFYAFKGFRLSATGSGSCSWPYRQRRQRAYANLRFGPCTNGDHITANYNAQVQQLAGTITIEAGATAARHIVGKHQFQHIRRPHLSALNILGSVNIGAFIEATSQSNAQMTYSVDHRQGERARPAIQRDQQRRGLCARRRRDLLPGRQRWGDLLRRPISAVIFKR